MDRDSLLALEKEVDALRREVAAKSASKDVALRVLLLAAFIATAFAIGHAYGYRHARTCASLNPGADVTITLQRSACFGDCDAYVVELHDDGSVKWNGNAVRSVSPQAVHSLAERMASACFFELHDSYLSHTTDVQKTTTTVRTARMSKSVRHDDVDPGWASCNAPHSLRAFEQEIDDLAGTKELLRADHAR